MAATYQFFTHDIGELIRFLPKSAASVTFRLEKWRNWTRIVAIPHIAPGKYLLHTRQAPEKEANDDQDRPLAWDAAERMKLRREAEAAKNEIELKACGRVKDHKLIHESARRD